METIKKHLSTNALFFTVFTSFAAFFSYLFFYPFRRAYTAGTYEGLVFFDVDYKILIVVAQVLGFAVSKGIGIKYVSEMNHQNRSRNLLIIICLSLLCYLFFGLTPAPYNLFFIFLASLPLGMVYGTILGFLEGRKVTDLLVAVLTASFIIGSGFAKSVGTWVMMSLGVTEFWMPFVACAIMLVPFAISVWFLGQIPEPNTEDQANRTERKPMQKAERQAFVNEFLFGIILFTISYILLTCLRDFRDNFTPEIWKQLGFEKKPEIFTQTETPIAIVVLLIMAAMRWVMNNYKAFFIIEIITLVGGLLVGVSTFLFQQKMLSPISWMVLIGLGIYFSYSMCNSLYFERMIASFKKAGTVGFLITFADFYAYLGTVLIVFYKNFFQKSINYLDFFISMCYVISVIYVLLILTSMLYFHRKQKS